MAQQDIVGSLFGMTPESYEQALARQSSANNLAAAQLSPGQLAGFYAMEAGTGLGRATQGLLGIEDPQLAKIRDVQQMRSQFDVSTPTGLRSFAQALGQKGYTDLAIQASAKAADIDKEISQAQKNRTDTIKQVGLTSDGRQVYQSGMNQFILTEKGAEPYFGKLESKQSKTEINLGNVFDKVFTTKDAQEQADAWNKAGVAYQESAKMGKNLRDMEGLVGTAFVGPYGSLKTSVSRLFGGGKNLSDTEVFDAISAELVVPMAKMFPGSLAVKELEQLVKTKPNLAQSEKTILRVIGKMQDEIKSTQMAYEAGERYKAKNDGKIQGFNSYVANNKATRFSELESKLKKNGKLSAEEKKEAEDIANYLGLK